MPEEDEGRRLLASLPDQPRPPRWWSAPVVREAASLVVSIGAISLNSQALPLLQAAEAARASALVVLAPELSDEALATLLVNDLAGVFPGGILPLRLHVPEYHVDEVVEAIASYLGVAAWDGRRDSVQVARVGRLEAEPSVVRVWHHRPSRVQHLLARVFAG